MRYFIGFIAVLIFIVAEAQASLRIYYYDKYTVDISIGDDEVFSRNDDDKATRYQFYRDSTLLKSWSVPEGQACPTYTFSDSEAGVGEHKYLLKRLSWDSYDAVWYVNSESEEVIDTTFASGELDNSVDNKFGRSPIAWSGNINVGDIYRGGVTVAAGQLTIAPDSEITMYAGLSVQPVPPSESSSIAAKDVIFKKAADISNKVIFSIGYQPTDGVKSLVDDSLFENVDFMVPNCSGLTFSGLLFNGGDAYISGNEIDLINSRGYDSELFYGYDSNSSDNNTIQNCLFKVIKVAGESSFIKNNRASIIYIYGKNQTVENNTVERLLVFDSSHQIIGNTIQNLERTTALFDPYNGALRLSGTTESTISNNIIRYNGTDGILLTAGSNNNIITGNWIEQNSGAGINIGGGQSTQNAPIGDRNIIKENIIEGNTKQGIIIVNSQSNVVEDNILSSNGGPIIEINTSKYLYPVANKEADYNQIKANRLIGSKKEGIVIRGETSSENEIFDNIVELSLRQSIYVYGSGNTIYNNIFRISGGKGGIDNGDSNIWNIAKSNQTNIVGGPSIGGNFWEDYTGDDTDYDGFGDTAYIIYKSDGTKAAQDNLPLMLRTVNSIEDFKDKDISDGLCDTGNVVIRNGVSEPECTIRAALEQNNVSDSQAIGKIFFDIPSSQIPVIKPVTPLPVITKAVVIDGTTQPTFGTIELSGSMAQQADSSAFTIKDFTLISGLKIDSFSKHGIEIDGGELQLVSANITNNKGWGIYNLQSNSEETKMITVLDSTISNNGMGGILANSNIFYGKGVEINQNGDNGISSLDYVILGQFNISNNSGYGVESAGNINLGNPISNLGYISYNGKGGVKGVKDIDISNTKIFNNSGWGIYCEGDFDGRDIFVSYNKSGGINIVGNSRINGRYACNNMNQDLAVGKISSLQNFTCDTDCYTILTDSSPNCTIEGGAYKKVIGSADKNIINVKSGANVECINFPGENEINIEESTSTFTIRRSGATVYLLSSSSGTLIKIPATRYPQTLRFLNGSSHLIITGGAVMLGNQEVTTTEKTVDTPYNSTDTSEHIF